MVYVNLVENLKWDIWLNSGSKELEGVVEKYRRIMYSMSFIFYILLNCNVIY